MTLFEQCVEAADRSPGAAGAFDTEAITRAVLETLRDGTGSLRTAEELTRVLEAGA